MHGLGSDDIDLFTATIKWVGPNKVTTLTKNTTADANYCNVSSIKDEDGSSRC